MAEFFAFIINNLKMVRIRDIFDIIIVTYAIYKGIQLVKGTRAAQLLKGVVILIVCTQLSGWMQLNSTNYILSNTMQVGVFALLVVFQPELRRILEKVGTTTVGKLFSHDSNEKSDIEEICDAVEYMASQKIGALILIERNTKLGDIMTSGTVLNAKITAQLLINIFMANTPLHDGATVIGNNMIKASACFLPLSHNNTLSKEMGTRHRAAVGVSEVTDCIAIIVSEETGKISFAIDGEITRGLTVKSLRQEIEKILDSDKIVETSDIKEKIKTWTVKKK